MFSLNELYLPIEKDIQEVENFLANHIGSENGTVANLLNHSSQFHGKRIRPALLLYSANICGKVTPLHIKLSAIVEIIHNATLVHDDVLDEAEIRRKVNTLNARWGNEISILFGDYLFSKVFSLCGELNKEAIEILAETTEMMCIGELSQLSRKYDFELEEAEYMNMIELKTASLFSTSCRLGAIGSNTDEDTIVGLSRFGQDFGKAFQITDDCLDITGNEREMGKSLGTDINRGKLTLPVIRLLEQLPTNKRKELCDILSSPDGLPNKKEKVLSMAREYGAMSYAMEKAKGFAESAKSNLQGIRDSIFKQNLILLADHVVSRNS